MSNNSNGRTNPAPRKLEKGMAVVVMFKDEFPLLVWERDAGITWNTWLHAVIKDIDTNFVAVSVNSEILSVRKSSKSVIIIRSVALADNLQPGELRARMKKAAIKQRNELLASK